MFPRRSSAILVAAALVAAQASPQTAVPDAKTGIPTFQLRARTVVVDVVVTDKSDQPVAGLQKQDFEVRESGEPQNITYFEEHTGVPPGDTPAADPLPLNTFTNLPPSRTNDSVNVLLLDTLNTPMEDQTYVRSETVRFLKNVQPGTRLGIFTLATELRFVQGFTTDLTALSNALNGKLTNPQQSALLRTDAQNAGDVEQAGQLNAYLADTAASGHGGDPSVAAALVALKEFQKNTTSFETDLRIKQTLFAMQQLARYLAGIPGRKNVIWFSGSFPLNVFPERVDADSGDPQPPALDGGPDRFAVSRNYGEEVQQTINLLAGAQVAIYPIAAEGVSPDAYNLAQHKLSGVTGPQDARQDQINGLKDEATNRNANHITMDVIAHDTGGEAFYNTNGIKEAVGRVLNNGARYYTVAYTPTNKDMNGAFRRIQIKVNGAEGAKLAYRRGYFATDLQRENAQKQITDPLHPFMGHGMPNSTEIPYTLRLTPSATQPGAEVAAGGAATAPLHAGDNANLKGPLTRYTAAFSVPVGSLLLNVTPDGLHHGTLETTLVVYDYEGKPLNWMVRQIGLTVKAEQYAALEQRGLPLKFEIDAPAGEVYLRTGIYDQASHAAGTLEVPLGAVTAPAVASK